MRDTIRKIKQYVSISNLQVWSRIPRALIHVVAMNKMLSSEGRDRIFYRFRMCKPHDIATGMALRLVCKHKFTVPTGDSKIVKCVVCESKFIP